MNYTAKFTEQSGKAHIININPANLDVYIILYETGNYDLKTEIALMQYLYLTENYRYKRINDFLRWGVISDTGINIRKYWEYFKSNISELKRINGSDYSKLENEINDSLKIK